MWVSWMGEGIILPFFDSASFSFFVVCVLGDAEWVALCCGCGCGGVFGPLERESNGGVMERCRDARGWLLLSLLLLLVLWLLESSVLSIWGDNFALLAGRSGSSMLRMG